MKPVFVTGHKNPDTDSFCSAIAYAHFKRAKGMEAEAICAGAPNKETAFVLEYFGVEQPRLVTDFYIKAGDVVEAIPALDVTATLADIAAWRKTYAVQRIPVVRGDAFVGMIYAPALATAALAAATEGIDSVTAGDIVEEGRTHAVAVDTPIHTLKGAHCGHMAVLDGDRYLGLLVAHGTPKVEKQRVILVDHNEKVQIIDGIEEAEIIENIDHHRIDLTTTGPIFIHYEPVGCTCTIIANFYRDHKVDIPQHIAGVLLSAILSDTVLFRSPTCTEKDIETARFLAPIAGVDLEEYGMAMLKAGADVSDLTDAQIVRTDCKEFSGGEALISIAQISLMDVDDVLAKKADLVAALEELRTSKGYAGSFLMVTNILAESTDLLYAGDMDAVVERAFGTAPEAHHVHLPKTMSRKKQIVPPVLGAL